MRNLDTHISLPSPCDGVLISGPTASGKSALALCLAETAHGAVINADSMQVYRELRILSARPGPAEEAQVPHLLYGHVPAAERYSVGRFATDAARALAQARDMGRLPIFVGGTGLYFAALTEGLAAIPPVPAEIRAAARAELEALGPVGLHERLAAADPETAAKLRPTDPQRVLRAYEVWQATGRPLAQWQRAGTRPLLDGLRLAKYVVAIPRPTLRERIALRFEAMLEAGAREEAEALRGLDPTLPAAKMLGLREILAWNEGRMGRDAAVRAAITATRQFAKRQETWARHRMADWQRVPKREDISERLAEDGDPENAGGRPFRPGSP